MKVTEITVNAAAAIEMVVSSFDLYKKGYKSLDEHLAVCRVIRQLFGKQIYDNEMMQEIQKQVNKIYPNL